MLFMGGKIRKVKDSRTNYKAEVRKMETNMNKALEEIRVDLVQLLPESSLYVFIWDLMGQIDKLR